MEWIRGGSERLCYAVPPADLVEAGVAFRQRGLLYEAVGTARGNRDGAERPDDAGASAPGGWIPGTGWPRSSDLLDGHPERYDYVTRKMAVSYSDAAARGLWARGRAREALPWFLDAARVGFDIPGARLNAATALAAAGEPGRALDELLLACRLAPYDPEPPARLAVFLARAGRHRDAAMWFERAFRAAPIAAIAADAARAWSLAGDPARAERWGRRAASYGGAGRRG
jgi:tetratricopeptide (TPR) repeat protein